MEVEKLLPRPAFIEDVARLALRHPEIRALILVDSDTAAASESLNRWLSALAPGKIVVAGSMPGLLSTVDAWGVKVFRLPDMQATSLASTLAAEELEPHVVVTCDPYDPFGTHVKTELESALLPMLERWGAAYLVHDLNYGTVRCYSPPLLRDRLHGRPKRLAIYRNVVEAIYCVAHVLGSDKVVGWRMLKRGAVLKKSRTFRNSE